MVILGLVLLICQTSCRIAEPTVYSALCYSSKLMCRVGLPFRIVLLVMSHRMVNPIVYSTLCCTSALNWQMGCTVNCALSGTLVWVLLNVLFTVPCIVHFDHLKEAHLPIRISMSEVSCLVVLGQLTIVPGIANRFQLL